LTIQTFPKNDLEHYMQLLPYHVRQTTKYVPIH
jgi:hypothetical protein